MVVAMSQAVRKAVIPAAGLGTHFLPATKAQPKEMLPLVDRPAIQWVVEEAVRAGLRDILIITGRGKQSIENHFDRSYELEHHLRAAGRDAELQALRDLADLADIHYVRQGEPLGLGHAIGVARQHVGDEPFAVLLGDDVMAPSSTVLDRMLEVHARYARTVVAVFETARDTMGSFGCVTPEPVGGPVVRVVDIVEKPPPDEAPSSLAVAGRYVFTPEIFDCIEQLATGAAGEIQLTDAIALLLKEQTVYGYLCDSPRWDLAGPIDWLKATVELGLDRDDLGPELGRFLAGLVEQRGLKP
jgi:UTP--glucose-1-phosphate uridylyltransferase